MRFSSLPLLLLSLVMAQPAPEQQAPSLLEQAQASLVSARREGAPSLDDPLWSQAVRLGEEALRQEPENPEALRFLAETYLELGWWSRSWERWRAYRLLTGELDPLALEAVARAGRQLAHARLEAGLALEAVAYYEAILDLHPDDLESYLGLARLYLGQNRPDLARPYWEAALTFDPENPYLLAQLHQAEAALRHDEPPDAFVRGLALYASGEVYQARLAFIEATETDPTYAEGWAWLARTRFEAGSFQLAADAYAEALRLEPANETYRYWLDEARRRIP